MVCSLHSVTTGSRDRANVSLIIIIIIIIIPIKSSLHNHREPTRHFFRLTVVSLLKFEGVLPVLSPNKIFKITCAGAVGKKCVLCGIRQAKTPIDVKSVRQISLLHTERNAAQY